MSYEYVSILLFIGLFLFKKWSLSTTCYTWLYFSGYTTYVWASSGFEASSVSKAEGTNIYCKSNKYVATLETFVRFFPCGGRNPKRISFNGKMYGNWIDFVKDLLGNNVFVQL